MVLTNVMLVSFVLAALEKKARYWYGTFGQRASASLYSQKKGQYTGHYTSGRAAQYRQDIDAGVYVVDCIGLIKWFFWSQNGMRATKYADGFPDISANQCIASYCDKTGNISTMPEIPGLVVWCKGHIGVYIGDGWAVEARGFDYGVVKTRVKDRNWMKWGKLKARYLTYIEDSAQVEKDRVTITSGNTVNVRTKPNTDANILGTANTGDSFDYMGQTDDNGWHCIQFGQKAGWISGKYTTLTKASGSVPKPEPEAESAVIVDVSQHSSLTSKGNDWAKIAQNVDLLILRCGVTRTGTKPLGIGIDAEFLYAAKQCQKHGIPFGVYYYAKVHTEAEAHREADKAFDTAEPYGPLFYVYDVEESCLTDKCIRAWVDQIRVRGAKKVGMYIAHHLYSKYKATVPLFDFIWIPRYGKNNGSYNPKYQPAYPCDIHQYTSVGKVPGFVDKTLDVNRLTGTKPLGWFTEGCDV